MTPRAMSLPHYLRDLLKNAVRDSRAPALLFSGGLDTTVLAHLLSRKRAMAAITVAVDPHAEDRPYADAAARLFGLTHIWVRPGINDLLGVLPQTIRILKTFDPMTIRNSLAPHMGLLMAKEMNFPTVMTGDGADELFAGYEFLFTKPAGVLPGLLRRLWRVMTFTSVDLGERLGIGVETPYLQPALREFAERVPPAELVADREGEKFGKAVLRKAFAEDIPDNLLWRRKCAAEFGSGATILGPALMERVPDGEFRKQAEGFLQSDGVRLRDKEHLYYYRLYRSQYGPPEKPAAGARRCPDCGTGMPNPDADFCLLCGAWPVP